MSERLLEIARRLQAQPWNRPGQEKGWVLEAMAQGRRLRTEVRRVPRDAPS